MSLCGVWSFPTDADSAALTFPSPIPDFHFTAALDCLSAFFLVLVCLVCGLASVYGVQYWPQNKGASHAQRVSVFLGRMTAGLIAMGLGLALIGRESGHAEWVMLGTCGALLQAYLLYIFLIVLGLLIGIINRSKGKIAGRRGPPVLQTYFDLAKLMQKECVFSGTTS